MFHRSSAILLAMGSDSEDTEDGYNEPHRSTAYRRRIRAEKLQLRLLRVAQDSPFQRQAAAATASQALQVVYNR